MKCKDRSKFARRGLGISNRPLPLPAQPTNALPGTPEKLAVLEQRARDGEALFHPDDGRLVPALALAS